MLQLRPEQHTVVVSLRTKEALFHRPMVWALAASFVLHLLAFCCIDITSLVKDAGWQPKRPIAVKADMGTRLSQVRSNAQRGPGQLISQLWIEAATLPVSETSQQKHFPLLIDEWVETAIADADFSSLDSVPYEPESLPIPIEECVPRVQLRLHGIATPQHVRFEHSVIPLEQTTSLTGPVDTAHAQFSVRISTDDKRVFWIEAEEATDPVLSRWGASLIQQLRVHLDQTDLPILNGELELQVNIGVGESLQQILEELQ